MLYSDASRREEERKHLQANFWTLGPPRPRPRRDQSISNSLYHPIVSWGWCGFSYTMWGLYEVWPRHMQSQEIEEFDANGPTTCHSSLNDTLLPFVRVSTSFWEFVMFFVCCLWGSNEKSPIALGVQKCQNVRSVMKEMNWICDELRKSQAKKNHVAQRGVRSPPLTASNKDGMMVVFLLLLMLLGNSGQGCSLFFTLLVPKDSLGCVYAGTVSIIRQIR